MPSAKVESTLHRYLSMMSLMPSRMPGVSAAELTTRLAEHGTSISKRSVERDLARLLGRGLVECNERGVPRGWYIAPDKAQLAALTVAEAMSLNLLESYLKPLLPRALYSSVESRFRQARHMLEDQPLLNHERRLIDLLHVVTPTQPLLPAAVDDEVLDQIQQAIAKAEKIRVQYDSLRAGKVRDFVLSPAGLFLRGAATFLVAAIDGRDDVNVFALHRIKTVERLFKQPLVLPKGFRLQEWLQNGGGDFGSDGLIELELKVSSDLARVLIETPLTEQMTAEQLPSGQFLIKAKVLNTRQLQWWLLSQSYNLMVINPPHLAQLIKEHHCKAAEQYK